VARKLAVVPPNATATTEKPPTTVVKAAEHSERALLVSLRTNLAKQIDAGAPAHALAALVRQLREVDHDIRALDARAQEEADDDAVLPDEEFDASSV
jgi:hypothetical protein